MLLAAEQQVELGTAQGVEADDCELGKCEAWQQVLGSLLWQR